MHMYMYNHSSSSKQNSFLLGKESRCTIEDVLIFFTGANTVPTLGFAGTPQLMFLENPDKLPTASTCDLHLRLLTTSMHLRSGWNWASSVTVVLEKSSDIEVTKTHSYVYLSLSSRISTVNILHEL